MCFLRGTKIAVVGAGKMGTVIAEGIIKNSVAHANDLAITGRGKKEGIRKLESLGARACGSNIQAVKDADVVLLCIKKEDMGSLLSDLEGHLGGRTAIYIAAGVSTAYVEERAAYAGVIAAMPNIGMKINYSHTALCAGKSASELDRKRAEGIFSSMGSAEWIDEAKRTLFTAACACTPAISANEIRHLASAFESQGISREDAIRWVAKGFAAAALLLNGSEMGAEEIESQVATKGGLTEAGLRKAESLGLGRMMSEIVETMLSRGKTMEK
ncbi:Pyrroline-5-carboxylate reductase [uncultured archaeon]|nr:Pyrroline-5-carboxylate reductase [uncultured archaeon]